MRVRNVKDVWYFTPSGFCHFWVLASSVINNDLYFSFAFFYAENIIIHYDLCLHTTRARKNSIMVTINTDLYDPFENFEYLREGSRRKNAILNVLFYTYFTVCFNTNTILFFFKWLRIFAHTATARKTFSNLLARTFLDFYLTRRIKQFVYYCHQSSNLLLRTRHSVGIPASNLQVHFFSVSPTLDITSYYFTDRL